MIANTIYIIKTTSSDMHLAYEQWKMILKKSGYALHDALHNAWHNEIEIEWSDQRVDSTDFKFEFKLSYGRWFDNDVDRQNIQLAF